MLYTNNSPMMENRMMWRGVPSYASLFKVKTNICGVRQKHLNQAIVSALHNSASHSLAVPRLC